MSIYKNFLTVNEKFIENLAAETADKLSNQCIYTTEDDIRISFMLIEKRFEDMLAYQMAKQILQWNRKHRSNEEQTIPWQS
jgi:hypothetical protein